MSSLPSPIATRHPIPRRVARRGVKASLRRLLLAIKRRLKHTLRLFSPRERWLFLALGIYLALMAPFFWLTWHGHEYKFLGYLFTSSSVALALFIPEIASKRRLLLRIALMLVPGVGLALRQAQSEGWIAELKDKLAVVLLDNWRHLDIRKSETRMIEDLVLDPIGSIQNGERASDGFLIKAKRLELMVFDREAQLIVERPDLAGIVLKLPENPRPKLKAYEQLRQVRPSLTVATSNVFEALRDEVAYLDIADLFRREIKPKYKNLENGIKNKTLLSTDACAELFNIDAQLRAVAVIHPVAGLYNQIGTLALNCGRPQEALGAFYDALSIDGSHITAYESLSYTLWIINKDGANALANADLGLHLCESERTAIETSFANATRLYESFEGVSPAYAPLVSHRINALSQRLDAIKQRWAEFVDVMTERLENDYAYFSALELKNEKEARAYIKDLCASNPDVAEYQDTMGFVLMRFAKTEAELDSAERWFIDATNNPNAGSESQRLTSAHLQKLREYRSIFQSGTKSTR